MNNILKPLVVGILATIILLGCTPPKVNTTGSVYIATQTYATTLESLSDLRDAGKLSEDDIATINEWEPVAWLALTEWKEAVRTGIPVGDSAARFLEALTKLETTGKNERGP